MSLSIDWAPNGRDLELTLLNGATRQVPASMSGFAVVLQLLAAEKLPRGASYGKTGSPQVPLQSVLDSWLRQDNAAATIRKFTEVGKEELSLEDLFNEA